MSKHGMNVKINFVSQTTVLLSFCALASLNLVQFAFLVNANVSFLACILSRSVR